MDDKVCDFLYEVDEYFKNGTVNVFKFKKFTQCHSYCPYEKNSKENKCTNNYERINALVSYLFSEIRKFDKSFQGGGNDNNRHIELFMIWLGDKLFKIENNYKATLEESYKKYLMNYMGNYDYWNALDSKKLYKNATIKKMSDLYGLLNSICKLIKEFNKSTTKIDRNRLRNSFTQCLNFYRTIHKSVNGCKPYLHLLDSLKMMYEIFRTTKMVNNNFPSRDKAFLNTQIQAITLFGGENKYLLPFSAVLSFNDKECVDVKLNDEQTGKNIELKKSQGTVLPKKNTTQTQGRVYGKLQHANPSVPKSAPVKTPVPKPPEQPHAKPPTMPQSRSQPQPKSKPEEKQQASPTTTVQQPPPASTPVSSSQNDHSLQASQTGGTSSQNKPKDLSSNKVDGANIPGGAISQPGSLGEKPQEDAQKKPNQVDPPAPGSKAGGQGSSGNQTQHSGNPVPGTDGSGTSQSVQLPAQPAPGTPGTSTTASKDTQDGVRNPQDNAQTGLNKIQDPKGGTSSQQANQGDKQVNPNDDPVNPINGIGNAGSGSKTGPSIGAVSQPQDPNPKQGGPGGTGGGSSGANGGTGGGPGSGANGLGDQRKSSDGSSDPASSTSGGSFNFGSSIFEFILKGKEYYNKSYEFIEQNKESFKNAAEKISNAYNKAKDKLKTTYDQSNKYLNKIINDVIDQLNKNDTPSKPNDKQLGPGSPMDGRDKFNQSPSTNLPPPSLPIPSKGSILPPPKESPPNPAPSPPQQKQPSSQSQHITQNPPQLDPHNHKANTQLVKLPIFNLNLKKTWNIFPTTWNGSVDCKPEIKLMNATLVCCTPEKCSLTGISVTLVLIPIILSIAYKYLSREWTKKSEKKNMKRVIKLVDGNRKTQIIINSHDRNKDLKPVINSVDRKKDPLLNIYKLMQADPIPFINLFFLLIFFVYKRKDNFLEL
ncbi:PIR protein CIR protein [Plasmodium vinckei]|uniref:PIR protein CIR protein n=1 Tax=Plasmodium vinckei TaxID=5860 RepID=A0A6V7TGR2_PLAVN|nr:PIR protein CIR protein [Plasmodium vinckei]